MSTTDALPLTAIRARDAMHAPLVAVAPATELPDIASRMAEHHVHAVIVDGIAGDRMVWGVVNTNDLIRAALRGDRTVTAGRIAATEALTVDAEDDLALVARRLVEHSCSHAVVIDGDDPVGIVSTLDIAAALAGT